MSKRHFRKFTLPKVMEEGLNNWLAEKRKAQSEKERPIYENERISKGSISELHQLYYGDNK